MVQVVHFRLLLSRDDGALKCPLKFGVIRGKSNRTDADAYHDGGGASLSAADSSSRFMSSQSRISFPKVLFAIIDRSFNHFRGPSLNARTPRLILLAVLKDHASDWLS